MAISELDMHISTLIIDGQLLLLASDRGNGSWGGGGHGHPQSPNLLLGENTAYVNVMYVYFSGSHCS